MENKCYKTISVQGQTATVAPPRKLTGAVQVIAQAERRRYKPPTTSDMATSFYYTCFTLRTASEFYPYYANVFIKKPHVIPN